MRTPNQQTLLVSRPEGTPTPDNFRLVEDTVPDVADGQVLVRHHCLSLDPCMRGRMNEGKGHAPPQPLDERGQRGGGRRGGPTRQGVRLRRRRPRRRSCDCIDYEPLQDPKALKAACPQGIDGHFENVGGPILDAVMLRADPFSRIAFCGMISGYDGEPIPMQNPSLIRVNRMKLQGFIVSEPRAVWPQALKESGPAVATGRLKYRETVAQGLASAPEAFLGLLKGRNFGKQRVKPIRSEAHPWHTT